MTDTTLKPAEVLAGLGITDATAATPVTGGAATAVWRVERPSGSYALRVFRPGAGEKLRHEVAAMEAARATGLPVPAVYFADMWQDRPVMLIAWCEGETLAQTLVREPWRLLPLGRAFGRTQALIHSAAPPPEWDAEGAAWIAWPGPGERALQERLAAAPHPRRALLHLDYHPLNVLVGASGVTAVLDWTNALAGDPRADVARTFTILAVEPYGPGRQSPLVSVMRWLLATVWRAGYEAAAGPLGDMTLYYAWAGAVMTRDLARRVDDPASWWQPRHLAQIRRWADRWRRRAGVGDA